MDYKGIIIEESLKDRKVLKRFRISETKVEEVTEKHMTPWLRQWTLHTITVPEDNAAEEAEKLSREIDTTHQSWYIDFKNDKIHYIIFPGKVFKIDRSKKEEYDRATAYGIKLGIPAHQLDFSPEVIV